MRFGSLGYRRLFTVLTLGVLVSLATAAAVQAADTPRRGGVLLSVIGAEAPSLDSHQESTFATLQVVAPCYSPLLQTDPYGYPKIILMSGTVTVNATHELGISKECFDAYLAKPFSLKELDETIRRLMAE